MNLKGDDEVISVTCYVRIDIRLERMSVLVEPLHDYQPAENADLRGRYAYARLRGVLHRGEHSFYQHSEFRGVRIRGIEKRALLAQQQRICHVVCLQNAHDAFARRVYNRFFGIGPCASGTAACRQADAEQYACNYCFRFHFERT